MRTTAFLLTLILLPMAYACDCYGPQSFCGVQAPPPLQWEYAPPEHIILGVKLQEVDYGMDVLVLHSFSGNITADTVRVWGDCGLLCRVFVDAWANGDTLVLGLQNVDYSGNVLCGTALEQLGHYQISICGRQWLAFENGLVTGPILTEDSTETMTLEEFGTALRGCLPTGIEEVSRTEDPSITTFGASIYLSWPTSIQPADVRVYDVSGALLESQPWNGSPIQFRMGCDGVYVVVVRIGQRSIARRIVIA